MSKNKRILLKVRPYLEEKVMTFENYFTALNLFDDSYTHHTWVEENLLTTDGAYRCMLCEKVIQNCVNRTQCVGNWEQR